MRLDSPLTSKTALGRCISLKYDACMRYLSNQLANIIICRSYSYSLAAIYIFPPSLPPSLDLPTSLSLSLSLSSSLLLISTPTFHQHLTITTHTIINYYFIIHVYFLTYIASCLLLVYKLCNLCALYTLKKA